MNLRLKVASVVLPLCSCAEPRATTLHPSRDEPNGALIVAYNQRVLAIARAEDQLLSLKGVRTLSMMHLAVHDALNAIAGRGRRIPAREARARSVRGLPGAQRHAARVRIRKRMGRGQALLIARATAVSTPGPTEPRKRRLRRGLP
jgi:hypothetical protein